MVRRFVGIVLILSVASLMFAIVMTAMLCGGDFVLQLTADDRCAASDRPYEVLVGLSIVTLLPILGLSFLVGLVLALLRVVRP